MSLPKPQLREVVRIRRRRLGLSLDEVAFAMGTSVSTLSRFERGMLATLPGEQTEADYEAVLDQLEAERTTAGAA